MARDRVGHGDSPRQDSQRPGHADHADAGGQEATRRTAATTQHIPHSPPAEVPPLRGASEPDGPLPSEGRQSQRPGQPGRHEDHVGARDAETVGSAPPTSEDRPR